MFLRVSCMLPRYISNLIHATDKYTNDTKWMKLHDRCSFRGALPRGCRFLPCYVFALLMIPFFAIATLNHSTNSWHSAATGDLNCLLCHHLTFLRMLGKGDIWLFSRQLTKWLLILLIQNWIQLISSLKQRLICYCIHTTVRIVGLLLVTVIGKGCHKHWLLMLAGQ